jgi:pyruvate/2-oxoglutarate dehydrogenase complex dihydrolipoamide dehydrogenase (E3) component
VSIRIDWKNVNQMLVSMSVLCADRRAQAHADSGWRHHRPGNGHFLQHAGRTPNGKKLGAEKAGVAVTDRGFINVDIQMRTNVPHIFAIGDIVGQPMLAHKAVHEAHVAAEVIAGELQGNKELAAAAFNARVIPSVAYTDPEVAWVGLTEDPSQSARHQSEKGLVPLVGVWPRHCQRSRRRRDQTAV